MARPISRRCSRKNGFYYLVGGTHILCVRLINYMWQWPVTFIELYLLRSAEMGRIDQPFADK